MFQQYHRIDSESKLKMTEGRVVIIDVQDVYKEKIILIDGKTYAALDDTAAAQ